MKYKDVYQFLLENFHPTKIYRDIDNRKVESIYTKHTARVFLVRFLEVSQTEVKNIEGELFSKPPHHTTISDTINNPINVCPIRLHELKKNFSKYINPDTPINPQKQDEHIKNLFELIMEHGFHKDIIKQNFILTNVN